MPCCYCGSCFFNKYKQLPIKLILLILWLTVIAETAARIPSLRIAGTNHLIYNCYLITAYPLLFYSIYRYMQHALHKKMVATISLGVVILFIIRAFTTPFITTFMVYMFSLSIIALVLLLLLYAVDLLKNNTRIILKNRLELFVFTGFMFFGITYIPLSFVLTGYDFVQLSQESIAVLGTIQSSTVIFMNVNIIIGFVWTNARKA